VLVAWSGNDSFKVGQKVAFTRVAMSSPSQGQPQHFRFGRIVKSRYVFSQFEIGKQRLAVVRPRWAKGASTCAG
jgi:hypothetical protein